MIKIINNRKQALSVKTSKRVSILQTPEEPKGPNNDLSLTFNNGKSADKAQPATRFANDNYTLTRVTKPATVETPVPRKDLK